MRKQDRPLWTSLLVVVGIAIIFFGITIAAGWSPKLGLDLDGGLSVVYQTHTPVNSSELNTIVTILSNRVNAGTTGATVQSQGKNQIAVSIPGEKNSEQVLATLGSTAQLLFRPSLCYAPDYSVKKGAKPSTGPVPNPCPTASSALHGGEPARDAGLQRARWVHHRVGAARPNAGDIPDHVASERQQERNRHPARVQRLL